MKNSVSFFISFMLLCTMAYAGDIKAIKTNESFEEVARIDQLEQIKINTMPRTTYTPKNLRTQYEMRFQGRNTSTGAMTVWSNTFTDYDTKITESQLIGDEYFIIDNTGKQFKTGNDTTQIKQDIQANRDQININTQDISNMGSQINKNGQDISNLNNRIHDLEQNTRAGLATVTALTSLHPNPRATAPVELSVGMGMYKDQCAGATGVFVHPNDWSMIQGGVAYGNGDNWAGFVGMTFSLPWKHKK